MRKWLKNNGPGTLVVAAFIGPGTVTLCAVTGASFGFSLLWAILLSIVATMVLQEMAARIGVVTQKGLTAVIKEQFKSPYVKVLALGVIFSAIVVGNTAYEAGNISGAAMGLSSVLGDEYSGYFPLAVGVLAFGLLSFGNYKILEKSLIVLVLLMSISFLVAAIITKPDIVDLFKGMFVPRVPEGSLLMVIGIVGTTVVPYNLFLHSSLVKEKWKKPSDLKVVRKDLVISIALGGIVSMAIMVCAASVTSGEINNVVDLAKGLEPLYGDAARYFLGIGLLAAGVTSAITAPLAAAFVARSCFGWKDTIKGLNFRITWATILILGVIFASMDFKPITIITFAQIANGFLLPVVALFLLWIVNKSSVLGDYSNSLLQNLVSIIIILLTIILGSKGIINAFG